MTVLEVGLLYGGLPVLQKDYHELAGKQQMDPVIRSGLLSAITSMAKDFFGDTVEEYKMKGYRICIRPVEQAEGLNLYAIVDKKTKTKHVHNALGKLAGKAEIFLENSKFDVLSTAQNPEYLKPFEEEIDIVMRDLKLKPEQRAERLFT